MKWWTGYWFRPEPLINLAVCRIFIVGWHVLHLLFAREADFRGVAALPDDVYDPLPILHLLLLPAGWEYRPTVDVLTYVHWVTVAAGILAVLGLATNLTLAAFTIGSMLLQAFLYSHGDFHHPEALTLIALSALTVSPCGRALSVDAWLRPPALRESEFAAWPLLFVQWMFALIYLSAFWSKIVNGGSDWLNGYTLQWYMVGDAVLEKGDVAFFVVPGAALWIVEHRAAALLLSWFTLIVEGTFWLVLVLRRWKWIFIASAAALHIGIYLTNGATFLNYVVALCVFVDWSKCQSRA